jgi:NitT/TauT family transport system ATP-binding protein
VRKITVENVSCEFGAGDGHVLAVKDVSLQIAAGEFLAIVGPSGCGKSTLLNMIAGLIRPSTGTVAIDDVEVDHKRVSRGIGYMLARDCLLPWRTAAKNVELSLELLGGSPDDAQEQVTAMLRRMRIDAFAKSYPGQLSQGMRQRVAIARTLVRRPEILLMDEPFGALDAQTRVVIQQEFLSLWRTTSSTVILVTHDLVEAASLAQRIVVFSHRPGTITKEYVVPHSNSGASASGPFDPSRADLYQSLWRDLSEENFERELNV